MTFHLLFGHLKICSGEVPYQVPRPCFCLAAGVFLADVWEFLPALVMSPVMCRHCCSWPHTLRMPFGEQKFILPQIQHFFPIYGKCFLGSVSVPQRPVL